MKKLLVMGSNFGSVEIVLRAKERGIYTIVTDYYSPSYSNAKQYCDECWDISITDIDSLQKKCIENNIDAVTCGVSEFSSEMTFKLCDRLSLPYYCSWESWSYVRNKRKFKDLCIKNGVPVAKDYHISNTLGEHQFTNIEYPVVVKPVDCGGNKGVSFCYNDAELIEAFNLAKSVSDCKETIICEQKIDGLEYAAAYALAEGECSLINLFAMHSQSNEPSNCYVLDVSSTGILKQYLSEIDHGIKKVFKDAGFNEGFVWVEFMADSSNNLFVLESGYRFPGGMLPYCFSEVLGFNAIDWYLDCFLGVRHKKDQLPEPQTTEYDKYGISYLLWNNEGGIISKIDGFDKISKKYPKVLIDFIRHPGYKLNSYSLMGEVLFTAETREEAINIISYINKTLKVINENGNDVLIRFTDFHKIY